MKLIRLNSADSTNNRLKELAKQGVEAPCVIIAAEQSAGRGSHERLFSSPAGGLYLSFLMRPDTSPEETAPVTKCAAVAVRRAILSVCPELDIKIKPVNDLLISGKKLCGILTELTGNNLVIGVGINVNRTEFPHDLNATSLQIETGILQDLKLLESSVIDELLKLEQMWPHGCSEYFDEYIREGIES